MIFLLQDGSGGDCGNLWRLLTLPSAAAGGDRAIHHSLQQKPKDIKSSLVRQTKTNEQTIC